MTQTSIGGSFIPDPNDARAVTCSVHVVGGAVTYEFNGPVGPDHVLAHVDDDGFLFVLFVWLGKGGPGVCRFLSFLGWSVFLGEGEDEDEDDGCC